MTDDKQAQPPQVPGRERGRRRSSLRGCCRRTSRHPGTRSHWTGSRRATCATRQARRPAVLDPRCDHPAQHRQQRRQRPDTRPGAISAGRTSRKTRRTSVRWSISRAGSTRPSLTSPRSATPASSSSSSPRTSTSSVASRPSPRSARTSMPPAFRRRAPTQPASTCMYDPVTGGISTAGQTQIDNALTLGMPMVGTAGDPSSRSTLSDNPVAPFQIGWAEAARRANVVGAAVGAVGLKWYWHVEQNGYNFIIDPAHPELAQYPPLGMVRRQHRSQSRVLRARHVPWLLRPGAVPGSRSMVTSSTCSGGGRRTTTAWSPGTSRTAPGSPSSRPRRPIRSPRPSSGRRTSSLAADRRPGRQRRALHRRGFDRQGLSSRPGPRCRRVRADLRATSARRARASTSSRATARSAVPRTRADRCVTSSSAPRTCSACGPGRRPTPMVLRRTTRRVRERHGPVDPDGPSSGSRRSLVIDPGPAASSAPGVPQVRPRPRTRRSVGFIAGWLLMLAIAPGVGAHDDPPGHYLETDLLYPAFANRPSPELEIQLAAMLQAIRREGLSHQGRPRRERGRPGRPRDAQRTAALRRADRDRS